MNPDFVNGYKPLIASLGHLGRLEEAKRYRTQLARREPGFSVERFLHSYPVQHDSDRQRYAEGLWLAGVPENDSVQPQTANEPNGSGPRGNTEGS